MNQLTRKGRRKMKKIIKCLLLSIFITALSSAKVGQGHRDMKSLKDEYKLPHTIELQLKKVLNHKIK